MKPKPRILLIALTAALALLVSACTVETGNGPDPVDPFPNAEPASASTNPLDATSDSLAPGESIVYEVSLSSAVRANQAMYFELDTDALDLVLYSSNGVALASSSSSNVFESERLALSSAVVSQAIGVAPDCRGTCIIRDANAATFFLEVINPTGSTVSFDAFLFSEEYADEYETENDTRSGAPTLTGVDGGAIEHLGDVDFWSIEQSGTVEFSASTPATIDLRMDRVSSTGNVLDTHQPGASVSVSSGEYVAVYEQNGDAAGVAAESRYSLELIPGAGPTDPFDDATVVSATTNPGAAVVSSETLGSGESVMYEVQLSSSVRANQAMYFELNTEALDLVLYSSAEAALASSSSSSFFEEGTQALSSAVASQAIGVAPICRGTCIIRDANAATFFLEVINSSGSTASFDAYLFSEAYADEYETENDARSGAPLLADSDTGAIEHLGDADYWSIGTGGTLVFSAAPPAEVQLRADVFETDGTYLTTLQPGDDQTVLTGDYVVVYELGDDAAAVAAESEYTLDIN